LEHEGVRADVYTLGKALGGGIMPVSAVVGRREVLGVLEPGSHGSTFGGNPLACAVGRAVVHLLTHSDMLSRATELGVHLHNRLSALVGAGVAEVRGRGLWAGVELAPGMASGRVISEALARRGVLVKETQRTTLRFAPPIVITAEEIDGAVDILAQVLADHG
jgi:ornithine--oxo-acid transaminase